MASGGVRVQLLGSVEDPRTRPARSWAFDVLVGIAVAALAAPDLVHNRAASPTVVIVGSALLGTALVFRRIRPVAVLAIMTAVSLVATPLVSGMLGANVGLLIALYGVAARATRRTALAAAAVLELLAIAASLVFNYSQWWELAFYLSGLVVAAVGLGLYRVTRIRYLDELRDRAARLERERDRQGELAAVAERARITREMHDIIAHHLTVMVALSDGAAAAAGTDARRAAETMRAVSATGRQALADTRRVLGVLRPDNEGAGDEPTADTRHPVPDLARLDSLVAGVRSAGLPVTLQLRGRPDEVPAAAQLTVYRLVQEALTNTLKHGGVGASATVRLHYRPDLVDVLVADDGAGDRPHVPRAAPVPGSGRGLVGIRERVQVFGGTVSAGPGPAGGWQVHAQLRLDGGGPELAGRGARRDVPVRAR